MPNFHRFTIKAQEALQNAQEIAAKKNHGELKSVHLLAALIEDEQSLVIPVLERSGVNLEELDEQIEVELDRRDLPRAHCLALVLIACHSTTI